MIRNLLLLAIPLFLTTISYSQENLKVMYYNLLKFPDVADRADTLKNIIQHTQPDIFVVNELKSAYGANLVMTHAMNIDGVSHYAQAVFQDANGSDTDNHLYYNSTKVGFIEQNNINANTRAISEYVLYYKDPNLAQTNDTTFLYVYGCHLKAGTASDISTGGGNTLTNGERRASAVLAFKNYLTNHSRTKNIIVGGDMNIYTSSETAYSNFTGAGTMNLYDPISQAGNWHNSYSYRNVHTQSTRAVGDQTYGGGSTGGLDDRFDMIFVSNDIMNGSQGAKYAVNSYKAVGQDGNKFNDAVNDGTNTSVPQDVAQSLFFMSDHLPVIMEIQVGGPVSIQQQEDLITTLAFNSETKVLTVDFEKEHKTIDLQVVSLSGQQVIRKQFYNTSTLSDYFSELGAGMYIINLIADGKPVSAKVLVY
jgi:exonuclease III